MRAFLSNPNARRNRYEFAGMLPDPSLAVPDAAAPTLPDESPRPPPPPLPGLAPRPVPPDFDLDAPPVFLFLEGLFVGSGPFGACGPLREGLLSRALSVVNSVD